MLRNALAWLFLGSPGYDPFAKARARINPEGDAERLTIAMRIMINHIFRLKEETKRMTTALQRLTDDERATLKILVAK